MGAIAQLHDLITQAIGLPLLALAQKARLFQSAQLVEQGALGHIQNAADLSQGELGLGGGEAVQHPQSLGGGGDSGSGWG